MFVTRVGGTVSTILPFYVLEAFQKIKKEQTF